jgi:hypothetical protein
LLPFSCFNSKKACCGGFSFDSHSANDEQQLAISLRMMSNKLQISNGVVTHRQIKQEGGTVTIAESSKKLQKSSSK